MPFLGPGNVETPQAVVIRAGPQAAIVGFAQHHGVIVELRSTRDHGAGAVVFERAHACWRSHPELATPVLEVVKRHAAIQRIGHHRIHKVTVVQTARPAARGNQQIAIAVLANGENLVARQAVFLRIHSRWFSIHQLHQAAVMKTHPDSAAMILINRGGLIARQAFRFAIHAKNIVSQPIQPAVHSHPEIAFGVFVDAAHPLALVRACQWTTDEASTLETRQAAIGARPKISIPVFPNRTDIVVR